MKYFLSIVLPPLAVLLTGKIGHTILNIILTCFGWVPGIIHALFIVNDHKQEKRTEKMVRSIKSK